MPKRKPKMWKVPRCSCVWCHYWDVGRYSCDLHGTQKYDPFRYSCSDFEERVPEPVEDKK